MFSFFSKKDESIKIKDVVWLTEEAKFKALANEVVKQPGTIVIAWFEQTYEKLGPFFTTSIFLAREINSYSIENENILFAEHYPLAKKEKELFERLKLKDAIVYSSLDEPLIKKFSGNKLQELMLKMGMKEDEPIEHQMITASIKNLQRKLAKKVMFEQAARSQSDWLLRNLPQ